MPFTALGHIKNQENTVRGPGSLMTDKYVVFYPCRSSGLVYSAPSRLLLSWGLHWVRSLVSQQSTLNMQPFLLGAWPPSWVLPGSSKHPCFLIHRPVLCSFGMLRYLWRWREFLLSPGSPTSSLSHSPSSFFLFNICKFLSNHWEKWSM